MSEESNLGYWVERKGLVNPQKILKQICDKLNCLHNIGKAHGSLCPSSFELNSDGTEVIHIKKSNKKQIEWNFKKDQTATMEEDIFVLGCLFYYVMTRGQHPFGRPGNRRLFAEFNLYSLGDLNDSEHKYLKRLIQQMIHYYPKMRPTVRELKNKHPIFWSEDQIVDYLTAKAKSQPYDNQQWSEIYLFPKSSEENEINQGEIDIATVSDVMGKICLVKNTKKTYN